MDFYNILDQVVTLLKRRGRVTYNTLKVLFHLDDEELSLLKGELLYSHREVIEDEAHGLHWIGDTPIISEPGASDSLPSPQIIPAEGASPTPESRRAELRHITVLFCDLADSTTLTAQLDPEDYREVVLAYQASSVEMIQHFDGHIAQYLGDGLLVYFGYPQAHEDDAQRAVRAGLSLAGVGQVLNSNLEKLRGVQLRLRIGIHTGPVIVGTIGSGGRHEHLALGLTPIVAARLQGLAAPNTVAVSEMTYRLVRGYFEWEDLGPTQLKGLTTPLRVYRVVQEGAARSPFDVAVATGLTPLVAREHELGFLRERWAQTQDGMGQAVLLTGEAGIGKSRLVRVLAEELDDEGASSLSVRCSPYHLNSVLYPVIEYIQRRLDWRHNTTAEMRLTALEDTVRRAGLPVLEAVPLLAALVGVSVPRRYPRLALTPQRQKQRTHETVVAWLLANLTQQARLAVWEDLHWADPSTLELLELLLNQLPAAKLLLVMTARPEFRPSWAPRSYVVPLTLTRLTRQQSEEMISHLTAGDPLPPEVVRHVVTKSDGIPLFVEELLKTALETGLVRPEADRSVVTRPATTSPAVPATLQDALTARLDRLAAVKDIAQLGAVLGREFTYEALREVAPLPETALRQALARLVDAELLYQRGAVPQATFTFKHSLIQDSAYQSLTRATRQEYHRRIAEVLAARFPDITEGQPELLAHHYTKAALAAQAVPLWHQAGRRAAQRSASLEAIRHFSQGLALLEALPETPEHIQQALLLNSELGAVLTGVKSYASAEVERTYARARELCQRVGDAPQLFPVLWGLSQYYMVRGELHTARTLAEQLLTLARTVQDPMLLQAAPSMLGTLLIYLGEFSRARAYLEESISLYRPQMHQSSTSLYGIDLGVDSRLHVAHALWLLGYPDQARHRAQEAYAMAQELRHHFGLAHACNLNAVVHHLRGEPALAEESADIGLGVAREQRIAIELGRATILKGWGLVARGQTEQGLSLMLEGLAEYQATAAQVWQPYYVSLVAEAYGKAGQVEKGLGVLADALALSEKPGEGWWEAELHRLTGELRLLRDTSAATVAEAQASFEHALAIARRQQAKSLELRAALSLSRLLSHHKGEHRAARHMIGPVYAWFTEGLDTSDLQDARTLIESVSSSS